MSRLRGLGLAVLVGAVAIAAPACSKDDKPTAENDRGTIHFADPPKGSTDLGLCVLYQINQMKDLIGGDNTFKQLAPSAIGTKADPVHGEACGWQRTEPNGDALSLRI